MNIPTEQMADLRTAAGSGEQSAPQPRSGFAVRIFGFASVLLIGLVVITVATARGRVYDPDLWLHMKVAQIFSTTHVLPSTDTFSYTVPGHRWTVHEWAPELSMYFAYTAAGYRGLTAWLCIFASLLLIAVFALCRVVSGDDLVAFLGALTAWYFATVGFSVRPLIIGHLLLALELLVLELGRTRDRRWFWCLPVLSVIWVNSHGSYPIGIAIMGFCWGLSFVRGRWGLISAMEDWPVGGVKTLGICIVLSGIALSANPSGIKLLVFPFEDAMQRVSHPGVNAVEEWLPPSLDNPRALAALLVAALVILIPLLRRSDLYLRELIMVAGALVLALEHQRMFFIFGIVAAPVLCRLLGPIMRSAPRRQQPILNAAIVCGGIYAIVALFPSQAELTEQIRKNNPIQAVNYIRQQGLTGPMVNDYVFGAYLIWALPEHKVFMDGRQDAYYGSTVFEQYGRWVTLSEDPQLLLEKYHVQFCLLSKGSSVGRVIPYLPGWHKAYSDDVAEVFVR